MKLEVTPDQYLAIRRLADSCIYYGGDMEERFHETRYLAGLREIIGRETVSRLLCQGPVEVIVRRDMR